MAGVSSDTWSWGCERPGRTSLPILSGLSPLLPPFGLEMGFPDLLFDAEPTDVRTRRLLFSEVDLVNSGKP